MSAFWPDTGYGTVVAEGKETREIDGRHYVLESALVAYVALFKAWKADKSGNLLFRKTARNFNPACAMAGKVCIVEVEEVVEIGAIEPDHVHLPGIYVDRIVNKLTTVKRNEQRTVRQEVKCRPGRAKRWPSGRPGEWRTGRKSDGKGKSGVEG